MKPGKNVRRQILRDMTGEPARRSDGSIITWPTPRGKAYPYSSDRQRAHDRRRHRWYRHHHPEADRIEAERIEMREALDWMMGEIRQSFGMRVA